MKKYEHYPGGEIVDDKPLVGTITSLFIFDFQLLLEEVEVPGDVRTRCSTTGNCCCNKGTLSTNQP